MSLTDSETLKFQMGVPIFIEDICVIYPATLREIVGIGYETFQQYLAFITMMKPVPNPKDDSEMTQLIASLTDFQYVLLLANMDGQVNKILREAFQFFCHDNVIFSLEPAQIIVGPIEEKHIMNEEQFYELQKIIRKMYFLTVDEDEIIILPDDNPAVKRMKMQMRKNREKVRLAKAREAEREKSDMKLSDLIGSMTINNCGLNMVNIWDMTYYAFHDQLKRMGWRDQFNINQKAALAGAKMNKSQLKHWMRSIASSDK